MTLSLRTTIELSSKLAWLLPHSMAAAKRAREESEAQEKAAWIDRLIESETPVWKRQLLQSKGSKKNEAVLEEKKADVPTQAKKIPSDAKPMIKMF